MKGWTGMEHLPLGDVREAPTIERSFHAGETARVFEPPIGTHGTKFITVLGMLPNTEEEITFWLGRPWLSL